jgi:hypothetical protein
MKQIIHFALFVFTIIGSAAFIIPRQVDPVKQFDQPTNIQALGISIVLYRVGKADKIGDLSNPEKQMEKSKSMTSASS